MVSKGSAPEGGANALEGAAPTGRYKGGPVDEDGNWSPRGPELVVHSRMSEDDDEIAHLNASHGPHDWGDFLHLLQNYRKVKVASAEFAEVVAADLADRSRRPD